MKGKAFWVAVATACVVGTSLSMLDLVPNSAAVYIQHTPIQIYGDSEFTPANGVVGGNGTSSDPYIIEGYEIDAEEGTGIMISNTDAHFVIRFCYVHNGTSGIYLDGVSNGSVSSCITENYEESIVLAYSHNSTIVGNTVTAVTWAIEVIYSTDCLVQGNNATGLNDGAGIFVGSSQSVTIQENNITGYGSQGIWVSMSNNCTIVGNRATPYGFILEESIGCHLWNNECPSGICLLGSEAAHADSHDIPENNTANGLPIKYLPGLVGGVYDVGNAGQIIIAGCSDIEVVNGSVSGLEHTLEPAWTNGGIECVLSDNITISGSTVRDCGNAVAVSSSTRVHVTDCFISNSWDGVDLRDSEHVVVNNCTIVWTDQDRGTGVNIYQSNYTLVSDCRILEPGWWGVHIMDSHDVSVVNTTVTNTSHSSIDAWGYRIIPYNLFFLNCTLTGASSDGLALSRVSNVLIDGSRIADCQFGIESYDSSNMTISNNIILMNSWAGIRLSTTSLCTITDNWISGNGRGVEMPDSQNVTIVRNSIAANNVGLSSYSLGLIVYHNDFYSNSADVFSTTAGSSWDDGYPSGGNHWDDYSGVDVFSGPLQNITGSDGIGDTPFPIPNLVGDSDNYPLMSPFLGPLNTEPIVGATVNPTSGDTTTEFVFDATSSSDLQDPVTALEVRWDFDNDGTWDTGWTSEKTHSVFFVVSGTYDLRVQIRDSKGFTNMTSVHVVVADVIPEFEILPISVISALIVLVIAFERTRRRR